MQANQTCPASPVSMQKFLGSIPSMLGPMELVPPPQWCHTGAAPGQGTHCSSPFPCPVPQWGGSAKAIGMGRGGVPVPRQGDCCSMCPSDPGLSTRDREASEMGAPVLHNRLHSTGSQDLLSQQELVTGQLPPEFIHNSAKHQKCSW